MSQNCGINEESLQIERLELSFKNGLSVLSSSSENATVITG
jgi:hypothetical protein